MKNSRPSGVLVPVANGSESLETVTIVNVLRAKILEIRSQSDHRVTALLGLGEDGDGARLLSRVTQRSWNELGLRAGLPVYAQVKGVALVRREDPAT